MRGTYHVFAPTESLAPAPISGMLATPQVVNQSRRVKVARCRIDLLEMVAVRRAYHSATTVKRGGLAAVCRSDRARAVPPSCKVNGELFDREEKDGSGSY